MYIYIYIYVYMCIYMQIYIYIHMYMYIHARSFLNMGSAWDLGIRNCTAGSGDVFDYWVVGH